MRFSTLEVSRAYSDYLDSLDDWPPPDEAHAEEARQAVPPPTDRQEETPAQPPQA